MKSQLDQSLSYLVPLTNLKINIVANELAAANTIISFWTDSVPVAAWITIWWVVLILVNVGAVTIFGEVEVVCSAIKFSWIFVVIISLIGKSTALL